MGLADTLGQGLLQVGVGALGLVRPRRLSILIFHRVLRQRDPLFPTEMDAQAFERLMRMVGRSFSVLTLGQAHAHLQADTLPARPLVITFDDGYADNAEVALPILQRHGLSATVFVSTGFLDGGRMWNDSIIETLRHTMADELALDFLGLGRCPTRDLKQRRATIDAVIGKVRYMDLAGRQAAIAQLQQAAGAPKLADDLMMTSDQVRLLHRSGIEIGGHTVNHPILTQLPDAEARHEIAEGKQQLESCIDHPVEVFAYPNGRPHRDYDLRHVDMVRALGFRAAVTTARGASGAGADSLQLPRFTPWRTRQPHWALAMLQNLASSHYEVARVDA